MTDGRYLTPPCGAGDSSHSLSSSTGFRFHPVVKMRTATHIFSSPPLRASKCCHRARTLSQTFQHLLWKSLCNWIQINYTSTNWLYFFCCAFWSHNTCFNGSRLSGLNIRAYRNVMVTVPEECGNLSQAALPLFGLTDVKKRKERGTQVDHSRERAPVLFPVAKQRH